MSKLSNITSLTSAARAVVDAYLANDGSIGFDLIRELDDALKGGTEGLPKAPRQRVGKDAEPAGRRFERAYFAACMAAREVHGAAWNLYENGARWAYIPTRLCQFNHVAPDGTVTKIKAPHDRKLPAARFWPGGEFPAGLVVAEPTPVETSDEPLDVLQARGYLRDYAGIDIVNRGCRAGRAHEVVRAWEVDRRREYFRR